jgi:hypothetical protein
MNGYFSEEAIFVENKRIDSVFGELYLKDYYWLGKIELLIWGENTPEAIISISGRPDSEFSDFQRVEFATFLANKERIMDEAETRIYEYYQNEIVDEYRDMFDTDNTDPRLPDIHHKFEMQRIMKFITVKVGPTLDNGECFIGLLYDCAWDEHGVGVKIVNGEVVEVDYQDIVI